MYLANTYIFISNTYICIGSTYIYYCISNIFLLIIPIFAPIFIIGLAIQYLYCGLVRLGFSRKSVWADCSYYSF